jgi:hypothetical protein
MTIKNQLTNTNLKFTFIVVICILFNVKAKDYFIDYSDGNDGNNGTYPDRAFKHCPGDSKATLHAASTTFLPGDTIIFKGGVVYYTAKTNIHAISSGSVANKIVYVSGHKFQNKWPLNSTQRAIIDGSNGFVQYDASGGIVDLGGKSNIYFDGFEVTNQPIKGNYTGCIYWRGSCGGNITINDCIIHNANSMAIVFQGNFNSGIQARGFTISNCTLYDTWCHNVMIRYGIDSVLIESNHLDRPGVDVYSIGNLAADNICLAENGNNILSNITIRKNDINYASPTPTKSHILLYGKTNNLIIERNFFHGVPRVSSIDQVGPITDYIVRNNIFDVKPKDFEGIIRFITDQGNGIHCSGIKIVNNTFVSTPRYGGIVHFGRGNSTDDVLFTDIQIRNNIFDLDTIDNSKEFIHIDENKRSTGPVVNISTFICNNNAYNTTLLDKQFFAWSNDLVSFTQWQEFTSSDKASNIGADSFINRSTQNYHLISCDNIAVCNGANLYKESSFSQDDGYALDYNGNPRPSQLAYWTIGAYEICDKSTLHKKQKQMQGILIR